MLTKKDGAIDWNQSARRIECLIRGLNPWPSAYTKYRGKTLKIWDAEVEEPEKSEASESADVKANPETAKTAVPTDTKANPEAAEAAASANDGAQLLPGSAAEVTKNSLKIRTGSGLLVLREVQPEGKKRMPVDAFLRGYPVEPGEKFGI
jgi:methionyl-tRNA formyltransferase